MRNPTYENVYRPEKDNNRERNSITPKLLSRKFICKDLLYTFNIPRFLEEPMTMFWLGNTGIRVQYRVYTLRTC